MREKVTHTRAASGGERSHEGGGHISTTTKPEPEVGDAYRCSPKTSVNGDAHGDNKRICGVVEVMPRSVVALTRTTHPEGDARTVESPKGSVPGFTKDAWWTDRNQRPLVRAWLRDGDLCEYLGRLPQGEKEELLRFWETTKMLGLANR